MHTGLTSTWKKSSRSGEGGNCVEVRKVDIIGVRDTKDREGAELGFSADAWTAFVDKVKAGAYDL